PGPSPPTARCSRPRARTAGSPCSRRTACGELFLPSMSVNSEMRLVRADKESTMKRVATATSGRPLKLQLTRVVARVLTAEQLRVIVAASNPMCIKSQCGPCGGIEHGPDDQDQ